MTNRRSGPSPVQSFHSRPRVGRSRHLESRYARGRCESGYVYFYDYEPFVHVSVIPSQTRSTLSRVVVGRRDRVWAQGVENGKKRNGGKVSREEGRKRRGRRYKSFVRGPWPKTDVSPTSVIQGAGLFVCPGPCPVRLPPWVGSSQD